jgi:hypothetical protein
MGEKLEMSPNRQASNATTSLKSLALPREVVQ